MSKFGEGFEAYNSRSDRNDNPYSYENEFSFWKEWDYGWQFGKDSCLFGG
jgi:hypothetical protein